jgi:hypothetical protein
LSTGDLFTLFSGQSGTKDLFQVQKTASAKQIRLQTVNHSSAVLTTNWVDLPAGWHALEVQSAW